jgi:hypothetical protein
MLKEKVRAEEYESKPKIQDSLDDALKVSIQPKKENKYK